MLESIAAPDIVESLVLGVVLAMDAMAVTLSNSLCEPDMPLAKKLAMPASFALFQAAMPVAGYFGGTLVAPLIESYAGIVSLAILAFVGGGMIRDALSSLRDPEGCPATRLTYGAILLESVATSIDAFVVGVSLAATGANIILYGVSIGATTLACCLLVLVIGRRLGERFGAHAQIAGGVVLILIGLKAFFA